MVVWILSCRTYYKALSLSRPHPRLQPKYYPKQKAVLHATVIYQMYASSYITWINRTRLLWSTQRTKVLIDLKSAYMNKNKTIPTAWKKQKQKQYTEVLGINLKRISRLLFLTKHFMHHTQTRRKSHSKREQSLQCCLPSWEQRPSLGTGSV